MDTKYRTYHLGNVASYALPHQRHTSIPVKGQVKVHSQLEGWFLILRDERRIFLLPDGKWWQIENTETFEIETPQGPKRFTRRRAGNTVYIDPVQEEST